MLVEDGDWRLGTLTDDSDHRYQLQHTTSGLRIAFDTVEVSRQSRYRVSFTLYTDGVPATSFSDSERLPNDIHEKLTEIGNEGR